MKKIKFLISFLIISIIGILKIDNAYALQYNNYATLDYNQVDPSVISKLDTYRDYILNSLYDNNYPIYYYIAYSHGTSNDYIYFYFTNNDYDIVNFSIAPVGFLYNSYRLGGTNRRIKTRLSPFGIDTLNFCEFAHFDWNITEYPNGPHIQYDSTYVANALNNDTHCSYKGHYLVSSTSNDTSFTANFPFELSDYSFIYDSNIPIYYSGSYLDYVSNFQNQSNVSDICSNYITNISDTGNYYNFNINFNDDNFGYSYTYQCGDLFSSYLDTQNNLGELFYSVEDYNNIPSSFDVYFDDTGLQGTMNLEFSSSSGTFPYVNGALLYGYKCLDYSDYASGNTCYWEELENSNISEITNDSFLSIENGYIFKFNYNIVLDNYSRIKLALRFEPFSFSRDYFYDLSLYTTYPSNFMWVMPNYYRYDYSVYQTHTYENQQFSSLIIPKSNSSLNYTFVNVPSDSYYVSVNYFDYYKNNNSISSSWLDYNLGEFNNNYYAIGNFTFDSNKYLYEYYQAPNNNNSPIYYTDLISTDVYVVKSNFNTLNSFTDKYNNTTIDYNINDLNEFLNSEINSYIYYDFDYFKQFLLSYEQKKDDWLLLFNTIWYSIPELLRNLIVVIYFLLHCTGIYLIFKD